VDIPLPDERPDRDCIATRNAYGARRAAVNGLNLGVLSQSLSRRDGARTAIGTRPPPSIGGLGRTREAQIAM